ncbi:chondroitin sulfate proteoglycan 4, partial [Asbolus verrucosus]
LSYNGVMVLEQARLRQLQSVVQRITWNCANEFEAKYDHPISFVEDDAFMLLSENIKFKEIKIQFDIKTITTQGLLFYNTGYGTKWDFFLIEIWKSNIRCIIKNELKNVEVVSKEYVSDGHWHKINVHISPTIIEINVDGKKKNEKNSHGHSFQLNDNSYIGGLEVNKRSRAISKGCKFCDVTFKGCMRHLMISDIKMGLSDVYVSQGLLPGCVWHYPCLQNPCKNDGVCVQKGLDSFQCQCQEDLCMKLNFTEGYKVFSRKSLATDLELLSVEPLDVLEGQSTIITTKNLYMILDYQKFGIKDAGINFYVVQGPLHGSITIDIWPHEKNSFSLSDIAKDKVHYIHDGSEFYQDVIVLEVEFSPEITFILPGYLQGRFRFSLSVNIVPVNDFPILSTSESTVLRIVQGTKKVIDSDLFKVKDPDSSSEQIIYSILQSDVGHFEYRNKEDVEDNKIVFVHQNSSPNDSYISLQVSDGIETSPITKIRISVSPQYWRLANNTGLTVLHQSAAVITPFNLSFVSNVVGVDHKIQFHIVKKPSYGVIEVEKNINFWAVSETFTNIDLKQHRVRYRHTSSKPDFDEFQFKLTLDKSSLYTFRLTFVKCSLSIHYKHDGSETQQDSFKFVALSTNEESFLYVGEFKIEITLKNDNSPVRSIDKVFHVVVGGERIVTGNDLKYSDADLNTSPSEIVYTCRESPNGNFYYVSNQTIKITEFTQNDLDNNKILFRHKGPEYAKVRLWVTDGHFHINGVLEVQASAPFIHVHYNKKLVVQQGSLAVITEEHLSHSTNVFASNVDVIYEIILQPSFGRLISTSDLKLLENFTQADISAGQTKDTVVFNVTNGMIWQNNIMLHIEIIPEQVYLESNNLTVNEGGIATLSISHLFVLTDYYKNKVKEYVILQDAKHGCIQVRKSCNKFNSFSHKELLNGIIHYAHDGSENLSDEVKLTAVANQKRSNPVTLNINILPVNDQKPKLVNNTGLIMWEGGVEVITNSMLAATDEDRPGDTLKYQVLNCWWGIVSLKSDLSTSVSHFTQELIDKKMIVFQNKNGTEAKFNFNISDGLHTTEEYSFFIKTKPVQLKLHSKSLHIFPLQRKYLTSTHLLTTVSDPDRVISYEVVTPPSLGRLMMESESRGIFKTVSNFTQNDLNNSQVFYEHTHQFSDLYANDSFVFNVKAHLARTLQNQVLKIDISVSSGGLDAYVTVPKISVNEGGTTTIPLNLSGIVSFLENHAGLRSPIIHATASTPQHGLIVLQHDRNISTFTQQQLELSQVYYEHDHSDSLEDSINFSLYLIPGYVTLCNVTVPIIVNPINDQPFNLVTPAPSLTVVQGENHTITRSELATEDADTPPSRIKYVIIEGPSQGKLILLPDRFPVMYFTQADIDNKILVYVHNSSVLKDSFHFRVWDEKFRPQFTLFNVIVLPIKLNISAGLPVYLQQGSDVVFLSEKQFFIETNANKYKIQYYVKSEPKRGVLYVKDVPSKKFTQLDLSNEHVMYLQTDMSTANDSFRVMGEIVSGNTSFGNEIEVTVKVQPLMQIRNFTVVAGEYNKITLRVLDATPLAKLTNSNPRYTVTEMSQYVQIRKVIRSSGEKRNVLNTAINSFTHEEIQSGLIYLVVKDIELPWNGIQDRLIFLLAASIFQPAVGELKINIKSTLNNDIHSTLAGPSDPAGHEGGLHFASPNMTRDYFLIVSMVAGVVILGVAVIVIIKCRSLEAEEMKKEEECLQPIPLPRPPDRLLASPSPLKQHHLDGFTPPPPTALPQ